MIPKNNTENSSAEVICRVYELGEDGNYHLLAEYTIDDYETFTAIDILKGKTESMQEFFKNTAVLE